MGRPKKIVEPVVEVTPEVAVTELQEAPKGVAKLVETKGKFSLFEVDGSCLIKDVLGRVICSVESLEAGRKFLMDSAR